MPFHKIVLLPLVFGAAAVGGVFYLAAGAYDPGADEPHWGITHTVLRAVRDRGIDVRVRDIEVPDLDDPALISAGAGNYAAMCASCHLAPGAEEGEIQRGMYPPPPDLAALDDLDPREVFWTIKHGVKMTGMPAWGKSMDNAPIWQMTAFVRTLPTLTPEAYAELVKSSGGHDHGEGKVDGGEMAGMDHGAKGGGDMAGMDHHGAKSAKGGGEMAGMDHGAMGGMAGMGSEKAVPPRRIAGSAESTWKAVEDALQVGNRDLVLERLSSDLVVVDGDRRTESRDAYARSELLADMARWKGGPVEVLARDVQEGDRQVVIVSELAFTGSRRRETVTLQKTPEGWKVSRLEREPLGS